MAKVDKDEIDLVIFATMTPDHYFPGSGGLLQAKLGIKKAPCFDSPPAMRGLGVRDAARRRADPRRFREDRAAGRRRDPRGFMPYNQANWDYLLRASRT
jgi:hypothetical protein